jgi:hypothetical protein
MQLGSRLRYDFIETDLVARNDRDEMDDKETRESTFH